MTQRLINYFAFAVLSLLWLGFGAALLINPEILQSVWQAFRGWPWVGQALITLLTLPVVLGLWLWQTSWPLWLRLILVIGLAGSTSNKRRPRAMAGLPTVAANPAIFRNDLRSMPMYGSSIPIQRAAQDVRAGVLTSHLQQGRHLCK